jgi:acetyltransferase-like isoleucine patch superfamily enzyme
VLTALKWHLLARLRGGSFAARALGVKVGEDCRIYTHRFGTEPWLVTIGNRVTVTAGVEFVTHDGATWLMRDAKGRRFRYAPIIVGNDVFIGLHALLMPGVHIGDRCIIGAGSVVTRSIPSGSIAAGVPARVIGSYADYEQRALSRLPSVAEMQGRSYRERVNSIVDHTPALFASKTPPLLFKSDE